MESGNGSVDRWEDATTATGSGTGLHDWTEGSFDVGSSDVEILKRVWRNEKAAPDILPYEAHLIERVHEQILLMEDNTAEISKTVDDLMLSIYQMDISRTTFLLKAYLRTRLGKIEKFVMHIIRTPELWERLSEQEQGYAQRYVDALSKHMKNCVLDKLETAYCSMVKQAESSEGDDMILEPDLDTYVFCRSKGAVGSFQLDERGYESVDLMLDDLYILRYRPVQGLLAADRIELV
ncbi:unnamed protein product [Sphagnum troendelagicum]|uniref:DNA replication complex GINS protein SLD5 n=1 Tax=Sphagnum troendelagicum TaxID=128251 RepID=A0ABP0TAX7_9BRYO